MSKYSSVPTSTITSAVTKVSAQCAVPFYGATGLNSGVVMVRNSVLGQSLEAQQAYALAFINIVDKYGVSAFSLADQDALNAYAHDHPDHIAVLPCEWNVRTDSLCRNRTRTALMHGSRKALHGSQAGMPDALRVHKGYEILKEGARKKATPGSAQWNKLKRDLQRICQIDDIAEGWEPYPSGTLVSNMTQEEVNRVHFYGG